MNIKIFNKVEIFFKSRHIFNNFFWWNIFLHKNLIIIKFFITLSMSHKQIFIDKNSLSGRIHLWLQYFWDWIWNKLHFSKWKSDCYQHYWNHHFKNYRNYIPAISLRFSFYQCTCLRCQNSQIWSRFSVIFNFLRYFRVDYNIFWFILMSVVYWFNNF